MMTPLARRARATVTCSDSSAAELSAMRFMASASNVRRNWVSMVSRSSASAAASCASAAAWLSASAPRSLSRRNNPSTGWAADAVKAFVF